MNIAAQFQNVPILLNKRRSEPSLEQVTTVVVLSVEVDRVGRLKSMHKTANISLRCLHHQVDVVCHQAKQIQANAVEPTTLRKLANKTLAVPVSLEDIAAIVATNGNVVNGTLIDDTQWPSHSKTLPEQSGFVYPELKFLRGDPKASPPVKA